jgi:hypothetical protein
MAGRWLAELDAERLLVDTINLVNSSEVLHRCYGLDASVWLPNNDHFGKMVAIGRTDRELLVRRYADEADDERQRNMIMPEYLAGVLSCPPNRLLSVCHYAQALRTIGDDEALRQIELSLQRHDCAPNKHAFLSELNKDIKKSWEKQGTDREDRLKQ